MRISFPAALLLASAVSLGEVEVNNSNHPFPPAEAASHMALPDGFKATLFAGEPDIVQPIAFTIDDRGRLWVVENLTYPNWLPPGSEGKDRIIIFDDPDGTGHYRSRKIFYDKGVNVSGIALGMGGVWLCSIPNLVFIPFQDGEDKPSGPPQIVLDGWNTQTKHNVFNRLDWGPDGWLYGCNGIQSDSKVGAPGTPEAQRVHLNCGVWRYHPVRKTFEVVASGTTNPWGLDWDDWGQAFITNCVIAHLWHVIPGAHFQRMYGEDLDPYAYSLMHTCADHIHWGGGDWTSSRGGLGAHDAAGGGHAHVGAMVYLGDNWPDDYRNSIFMCNLHGNRVNHDILEQVGSGYVGHHGKDFLLAHDTWFRGIDLRYGPDGGVFITDWTDTGECHNYKAVDRTNGRIYKVTYNSSAAPRTDLATLNIASMSDAELVKLQLHKNDWWVRHARRVLQERAIAKKLDSATVPALLTILKENPDVSRKLRALWALDVVGAADTALLADQLASTEPYVRSWAIRLSLEDRKPSDGLLTRLVELAKSDPSPVVRLELASGLQRIDPGHRWEVASALVSHREDIGDANLPLMYWYGIEPLGEADPQRAANLIPVAQIPIVREYLARRIAPIKIDPLVGVMAKSDSPELDRDVLVGMHDALREQRASTMPEGWEKVAAKLEKSPSRDVRIESRVLSLLFGDQQVIPVLRQVVADTKAEPAERRSALDGLIQVKDSSLATLLESLITDPAVSGPAIRAAAAFGDEKTTQTLVADYANLSDTDKRDTMIALASRASTGMALLEAVEQGKIPRRDMSAFIVRALSDLNDPQVSKKLASVWGTIRPSTGDKAVRIAEYKKKWTPDKLKYADRSNGRLLFSKSCALCHTLFDSGGTLAPNLTGSQRANLDYLLGKVLDPNSVISRDYQMTIVQKKDGQVINGIVSRETPQTITLRTPTEDLILQKSDIGKRKASGTSMMPEGLLDGLTDNDTRDLLAYIASPEQVAMPATQPK